MTQEKFLPSQHAIESYTKGGFRFGGYSHLGALLSLPSGMRAIDTQSTRDIPLDAFALIVQERESLDFLLIGQGDMPLPLPPEQAAEIRALGLQFDCMTTSAAASTYNILLGEKRRVAAFLKAL